MGITEDSIRYMSMAKHIEAGRGVAIYHNATGGVSRPVVNFQPLWPVILSAVSRFDDGLRTGTWALLNLILFLNLLLAGALVFLACRRISAAVLAQLLLCLDRNWLSYHCYVLTEALFFTLTGLAVLVTWKAVADGKNRWLFAAGAVVAAASFQRYVGALYAGGVCFCVFLFDRRSLAVRFFKGIAAAALSLLPLGIWFWRHYLVHGEGFDRGIGGGHVAGRFYPAEVVQGVLEALVNYPAAIRWVPGWGWAPVLLFAAAGGVFVFRASRTAASRERFLPGAVLAVFAAVYTAGLAVLWTWRGVDHIPDPMRFMAPAYHHLWCLAAIAVFAVWDGIRRRLPGHAVRPVFAFFVVLFLVWVCFQWPHALDWAREASESGLYGRRDVFSWDFVGRISWFPAPPVR